MAMSRPHRQRRVGISRVAVAGLLVVASLLGGGTPPAAAAPPTSGAYYGRVMVGERPAAAGEVAVRWGRASTPVPDLAVALTDADGYFQVPTAPSAYHQILFDFVGDPSLGILDRWLGSGYQTERARADSRFPGGTLGTILLLRPFDVAGSVSLGVAGVPAPPADVIVDYSAVPSGSASGPWSDPVDVASDGTFLLDGLPPGNVAVRVRYVGSARFDSESIVVLSNTLTATPPSSVAVTLASQSRIRGTVRLGRAGAVPVPGDVDVALSPSGPGFPVSASGGFDFWIDPPEFGPWVTVYARYSGSGDYLSGRSAAFANAVSQQITIPDAFVMSGTVDWGDDGVAPPSGLVRVTARALTSDAPGLWSTTVVVAGDGTWTMPRMPRGTYTLTVRPQGSSYAPTLYVGSAGLPGQAVEPTAGFALEANRSDLDLVLPLGAQLRGRVTDAGGSPISGVAIELEEVTSSGTFWGETRSLTTAADGTWHATGLKYPAWYRVRVAGPAASVARGYWVAASNSLTSASTAATLLSLPTVTSSLVADATVPRLGSIGGVVTALRTASGWTAQVDRLGSDGIWRVITGTVLAPDGGYQFPGLIPGTYRVRVVGSSIVSPPLVVAEGERTTWKAVVRVPLSRDSTGDGRADVLVRDARGAYTRSSVTASGRLGSRVPVNLAIPTTSTAVVIGDVTGDGFTDLVVRASDGTLSFSASTGADAFAAPAVIPLLPRVSHVASVGDRNGDGYPDLFIVTTSGEAYLRQSTAAGSWGVATFISSGWGSLRSVIGVGDFDGDARGDIVVRTASGTSILCRAGYPSSITFECDRVLSRTWTAADAVIGAGDVNGDGASDILVRRADGVVLLYRGTGSGGFRLGAVEVARGWKGVAVVA